MNISGEIGEPRIPEAEGDEARLINGMNCLETSISEEAKAGDKVKFFAYAEVKRNDKDQMYLSISQLGNAVIYKISEDEYEKAINVRKEAVAGIVNHSKTGVRG